MVIKSMPFGTQLGKSGFCNWATISAFVGSRYHRSLYNSRLPFGAFRDVG